MKKWLKTLVLGLCLIPTFQIAAYADAVSVPFVTARVGAPVLVIAIAVIVAAALIRVLRKERGDK